MNEVIVIIVDDLMFQPRLEKGLQALGYQPLVATNETALTRALFKAPVLIILDLFSRSFDWELLVRTVKGPDKKGNHVPILGFGPHVDLDLRARALEVGCDAVVGRGAISSSLPSLINKHRWQTDRSRCADAPPPLLLEGLHLFNRGEYYDCHEVIEDAWRAEKDPVRVMYQGILQIGVACYHIQQQNWRGAIKMVEWGLAKIEGFTPGCMGINIAQLVDDARAIRRELVRLGPDWAGTFDPGLFFEIDFQADGEA